ncbi:amidohydrolase [Ensifer sp. LC163]|uniref:amidohydrolase n=1 Tax=Ensifer sp. LC163 TaxID=1120652 RepID=UPI000B1388A6|nr:amidohydrolase [Ensifer sp. LC163]
MNDAAPTAEAVLVRAGRIIAAGPRADVEKRAAGQPKLIDLGGRTMLPGFFDPHGHVIMIGLQALSANLLPPPDGEGADIAAIQRLIKDWIGKNGKAIERYGVVIGFGYDDSQLKEQRHPTRDDLDAVSTDVPIILIHQSSHLGTANSKALEIAKVSASTENPKGGIFRRREGSSEPNGVMEEYAFFQVMGTLAARFDEDAYLAMISAGARFSASFGYTTVQEARAMGVWAAMLGNAAEKKLLPVDVLMHPDILDAVEAIAPTKDYRNRLRIGGAKLTIDGSPQGKTAWLTQPYFVPPEGQGADYVGYPAITNEQATEAINLAFSKGWPILVHCNGDAAIDQLIASVGDATKRHGGGDRRTVLIHGQCCRIDQLDSLKELGIIPSFFPMHTFYWGDWHRDSVLGPVRAENISPCASALERGMIFTSHHDAPVANPDSMRVLSATVARRTRSGDILGPNQRVSVENALKAMTIWPAYQHFEEATKGSIEAGKLADFVILDQNPLTTEADALASLKVVETIKEGATVYTI